MSVVQGRAGSEQEFDDADRVYRPRPATAKAAAVSCAVLLVLAVVTGSRDALWWALIPLLLLAQCFQTVKVYGDRVCRNGLRAVELDLSTAEIKATGRSWWLELFFLGRCLELRDADRHGLLLESWLWSKSTRNELLDAVRVANPSVETNPSAKSGPSVDQSGEAAHS